MTLAAFLHSGLFQYLVLPVLIFCARICDVSLGTIRIIFVSRGRKFVAPVLGFFEVLIWLIVITQILRNLTNPVSYVAYAAGFAMGNFVGILIEERLGIGVSAIRIIGTHRVRRLSENLRKEGWGVTETPGRGARGPVTVLFTMVKRKDVRRIVELINRHDPKAFYSIEDARMASEGIFPNDHIPFSKKIRFLFRFLKPGK